MKPHIQILVGTTRSTRVGRKIADWVLELSKEHSDMTFEIVDLAEVNLPMFDEPNSPKQQQYEHDHTKEWSKTISKADGYIWVTGEYNHAIPPSLINAIDFLYHEWGHKPVAFVGYGGLGAARAVEQLISVANELRMVSMHPRISIIDVWAAFDDDGKLKPEHIKNPSEPFFEELAWWAKLLKSARES